MMAITEIEHFCNESSFKGIKAEVDRNGYTSWKECEIIPSTSYSGGVEFINSVYYCPYCAKLLPTHIVFKIWSDDKEKLRWMKEKLEKEIQEYL